LIVNPQRAYGADQPSNVDLTQLDNKFLHQEELDDIYVGSVMNQNLSFVERGGVFPKMVSVADLEVNPQRGYSASDSTNGWGKAPSSFASTY
jgi:hypothetical protein